MHYARGTQRPQRRADDGLEFSSDAVPAAFGVSLLLGLGVLICLLFLLCL
jgi:hypothetical protein